MLQAATKFQSTLCITIIVDSCVRRKYFGKCHVTARESNITDNAFWSFSIWNTTLRIPLTSPRADPTRRGGPIPSLGGTPNPATT